ncbi:MAG TPA: hypothetical protein VF749_07060 [Candidatus Acidoferrum sp.]
MRKRWLAGVVAIWIAGFVPKVLAQDKPKTSEQNSEDIRFSRASLRVQVVFTEYEGDKKLKSLPYSFLVTTHTRDAWPEAKIRVGSRVPVYTGGEHGSVTYMDVGTNIDCRAEAVAEGQYRVYLNLERSWVEGDVLVAVEKANPPQAFHEPVVRQYKTELSPVLKDGQSVETSLATDPLSGKVVKLEVSISPVK